VRVISLSGLFSILADFYAWGDYLSFYFELEFGVGALSSY
jgi:hypothetical protein